ncbi:zinc-dependent alcohol dehydrogenase [Georgenia deserti]|uniref:Zinc-binding alcohol dehydrogenase n=1 Tax=Georgenia deserti TaxID=2093781 RepID=A0ABW4L840_9MICO
MWTAYWTLAPGTGELRSERGRRPGEGEVLVRALRSGVSRGTETLVHTGGVPAEVADLMRAPFQDGDLPGPVKYGYLSVGLVEDGPAGLVGRRVFALHPHQDRYVVPVGAVTPVPDDVPTDRAVLAGTVETAVNVLWDAAPHLGDRIAVVGGGMVGGMVTALARTFPLDRLQLVDVDPARADLAEALGVDLVRPEDAAGDCDLVIHCSATEAGLARGLEILGDDGTLVEVSWYGTAAPRVPLGTDFHARRLSIRASQVGAVAAARRARRTTADRLALAMRLLADPVFDVFLTGRSDLADLPEVMPRLAAGEGSPLCHLIVYPNA